MDPVAGGLTRAAVWTGDGVDVRDVPVPRLGAGELLVRVRLATVCGSDLHTVAGRRPGPRPSVLGHEAVGDVVAAGPGAGTVVGTRVVWTVTASCGACDRCVSGRTAKCRAVRKVGHEPFDGDWALSGGFAHHIVLPAGVGVVRVPDSVPDVVAAPAACATATAVAA
ncbi:dehydrogenase, partial [Rhodococcus rhodochrous]